MAITNYVFMTIVVLLTLGYHVEFGFAPKNETFAIVCGESYCEQWGERISVETIPAGALRFQMRSLAGC
jgi:hypothetical protein